jgi:Galactose oxidase, central domain
MNTGFAKSTGNTIGAFLEALLLFLIAVAGQSSLMTAQSPGPFTATGSMTTARVGHTATLLPDGRVLIAGGSGNTAELYNPSTKSFTATGNMTTGRSQHTATLLADGTVLIAGGGSANGLLASAELYDPSTGTFVPTGDMIEAQSVATATLLTNGKVLIASGLSGWTSCCPIATRAELYDPSTGAFTLTGEYADTGAGSVYGTAGLVAVTATLLPDGRVLIAAETAAELYDPVAGTFTFTGVMATRPFGEIPAYIAGRTAALLPNGRVLAAGGEQEDLGIFNSADVYDPSTGAFTATGNMTTIRAEHTATPTPDGRVLLAGGQIYGGVALASAELYDPVTGTFSATGNMTTGRFWQTATLLGDGTVLIAGGTSQNGALILASAELYHPAGVQGTPTVQIVDNNTGSLTTLAVGDSFSFQVTGAPPLSLVSVSEPGWSGSVGYTDASGLFWLNGIVGSNVVGTWQQTWTIGGLVAQPSPLQFTITPKP